MISFSVSGTRDGTGKGDAAVVGVIRSTSACEEDVLSAV